MPGPTIPASLKRALRWSLLGLAWAAAACLFVWALGAVRYSPLLGTRSSTLPLIATALYATLIGVLLVTLRGHTRRLGIVGVSATLVTAAWFCISPRNDRPWVPDQARLPTADINGDTVTIRNIRSNTYRSTTDFDLLYRDETYDLRRLDTAWFIVEPFPESPRLAHTLLSFGFDDGRYLAVSVEVRREQGESFSALRGLYRNFELMYVLGDESDLVRLRTDARAHDVYMYPIDAAPTRLRAMLLHILDRANGLASHPEFYNTLTSTCTTAIMDHANRVADKPIPWAAGVVFPGGSDHLAYLLKLIPHDKPFEEVRAEHLISHRARACPPGGDFSRWIRGTP